MKLLETIRYIACALLVLCIIRVSAVIWGTDEKGHQLYKHKTIDGVQYAKRRGLVHILHRWNKVRPTIGSLDILSLYPNVFKWKSGERA